MGYVTGLVWDDEPELFMQYLKEVLRPQQIELSICEHREDFESLFRDGSWDFVILDLFDEASGKMTGLDLARLVSHAKRREQSYPIFILTQFTSKIVTEIYNNIPLNAVLRGKSDLFWTAQYIKEELIQRGVYVDKRRVFCVHNVQPQRMRKFVDPVKDRLVNRGLQMVTLSASDLVTGILDGLMDRMNQCGAIVSICTADDIQHDGSYQPRQNVLFEIGLALGLNRGLQRLIVLQQWGATVETQAKLPSDLGGVLTIQFKERIGETLDQLEDRLRDLRMSL